MFTKFLNNLKGQEGIEATTPTFTKEHTMIASAPETLQPTKRRWSHVTYLNQGTLHGDGDNLVVGL